MQQSPFLNILFDQKVNETLGMMGRPVGERAALPFFKRAIELDPNFAGAYSALGIIYLSDLDEPGLATENLRKAYELRDRRTEREKLNVPANYYSFVTGETESPSRRMTCMLKTIHETPHPTM